MSDATTVLFWLPGVRVERVERRADGTRVVDTRGPSVLRTRAGTAVMASVNDPRWQWSSRHHQRTLCQRTTIRPSP